MAIQIDLFTPYSGVLKANPYHDERGRFTSGPGGGGRDLSAILTKDPRVRLADALGLKLSPHFRTAVSAKSATARENARRKIDYSLAEAASKMKFKQLLDLGIRNRKAFADKILTQMTYMQRGRLAERLGVRNEFAVVDHALRLPNGALHRAFWDQLDAARARALAKVPV